MKTGYRIWEKPRPNTSYRQGSIHDTLDAAKAASGFGDDVTWGTNGEGNHWPEVDGHLVFVGEEQVPESLEDRVQLAVDLIVECRNYDGQHHQLWLTDQVVRILTGDRYEQIVAEATERQDGMVEGGDLVIFGGGWDTGVAP